MGFPFRLAPKNAWALSKFFSTIPNRCVMSENIACLSFSVFWASCRLRRALS